MHTHKVNSNALHLLAEFSILESAEFSILELLPIQFQCTSMLFVPKYIHKSMCKFCSKELGCEGRDKNTVQRLRELPTSTLASTHTHTHTHIHTCTHSQTHTHSHTHTYTRARAHTHTQHAYAHTHRNTQTHRHTHTHTHTHTKERNRCAFTQGFVALRLSRDTCMGR